MSTFIQIFQKLILKKKIAKFDYFEKVGFEIF